MTDLAKEGEALALMRVGIVVAKFDRLGDLNVLLTQDGDVPYVGVGETEAVAVAATRLFQELTGITARLQPSSFGWVDLESVGLHDDPTRSPRVWTALYVARVPSEVVARQGHFDNVADIRVHGKPATVAVIQEALNH